MLLTQICESFLSLSNTITIENILCLKFLLLLPTTCMGKLENGCDNLLLLIKFSLQASTLILKQQSRTKINHKNSNRNKKHLVINSVNSNYPWKIIAIRSTVFSKNHPPVEEISYLTLKKWSVPSLALKKFSFLIWYPHYVSFPKRHCR